MPSSFNAALGHYPTFAAYTKRYAALPRWKVV
jgi:hypothetical protein